MLIKGHWYRPESTDGVYGDPCAMTGCGFPPETHVQAVGEWMWSEHTFRPALRHPLWCRTCGKNWRHSRHILISKKWRSLRDWRF